MGERGVSLDRAGAVHRWGVKMLPVLAKVLRSRMRNVGRHWRIDETYIKLNGDWKYLYRAVARLAMSIGCCCDRTSRRRARHLLTSQDTRLAHQFLLPVGVTQPRRVVEFLWRWRYR